MDARELEEFDIGIDLAKNKQEQAANFIFNRLLENHPDNIYLLTLCAFTASTPAASLAAIETARRLDPADSMLLEARSWLEEYHRIAPETAAPSENVSPLKVIKRTYGTPYEIITKIKPSPKLATRPFPVTAKPMQPVSTTTVAKMVQPPTTNKSLDKPEAASFSGLWWLLLGCSLVFFGAAMAFIYMVVVADNLTEPEKAYLVQISQLNLQTDEVNSQLHAAIDQYNGGKLEKSELVNHLRHVIGLDEKFRLLKNPSARFGKLNGLLGQAYSYFNQGAVSLIFGLNANDARRVSEGSRQLNLGNDYLRQARDELKRFGG